jgi:hypothetical protein
MTRRTSCFFVMRPCTETRTYTVCSFRVRHLEAFGALFVETLRVARESGLKKVGHLSVDGTKVKANASKHKAMSYGRMEEGMKKLKEQIDRLLAEAAALDEQEDKRPASVVVPPSSGVVPLLSAPPPVVSSSRSPHADSRSEAQQLHTRIDGFIEWTPLVKPRQGHWGDGHAETPAAPFGAAGARCRGKRPTGW